MGTIYMIRHGQASFGSEDYDRLSPKGIIQSRVLAEYLAAVGVAADILYSGQMKRQIDTAKQTVEMYKNAVPPILSPRIEKAFNEYGSQEILLSFVREIVGEESSLPENILQKYAEKKKFQELFEQALSGWATGKYKKEGLPTWEEFTSRVWNGIEKIINDHPAGRTILIFTSGGPISAALQRALKLSNEETIRLGWQIANASITKFLYKGDRFTIASFNETAHLSLRREQELVTYR
ncbi:MAG: histidine phosphatase family protein [Syntrophobacterales bacterium]|nr:histidine phosphatase family protein [Syntrophobacterales bacterium]